MQQHENFAVAVTSLREPRVPLTEAQHADYQYLMAWAQSLRAEGKRDEARRITCVAAKIVQSGAPGLE